MNIYETLDMQVKDLVIDVNQFKPSRLYINRILRESGQYIYYFGKSWREDLQKYCGSGVIWSDYVNKYNNVEQVWLSDWYNDPLEIQQVAIRFSLENAIVESDIWANLKIENGIDGGLITDATRDKISRTMKGKTPTSGTTNTIWINNGSERACIAKTDDIPSGWIRGLGSTAGSKSVLNKIKYNNGKIAKYFAENEEIPSGWIRGDLKTKKRASKIATNKRDDAAKMTPEERKQRFGNCAGRKWYHNDEMKLSKRFYPNEVATGYTIGRKKYE